MYIKTEVMVSTPALETISEDDVMVEVCATLSAIEDTERNLIITLTTSGSMGIIISITIITYALWYNYVRTHYHWFILQL